MEACLIRFNSLSDFNVTIFTRCIFIGIDSGLDIGLNSIIAVGEGQQYGERDEIDSDVAGGVGVFRWCCCCCCCCCC